MSRDLCILRFTGRALAAAVLVLAVPWSAFGASAKHYSTLGPGAALNSEANCVTAIKASPITTESAPWNVDDGSPAHWNSNLPPPESPIPSYFYDNASCCTQLPNSDFSRVDGNYSGSTDDLIRITACKWGIDEDYIRAQAWIESGWHQDCAAAHGGAGCNQGGDKNNPPGCTPFAITGGLITDITPNGLFCDLQGFGGLSGTDQYDSWSLVQTKVYYQWATWPMIAESTPFALDYRYAQMRGCMNGDQYGYFNSQDPGSGADYSNAVTNAKNDPFGGSRVSGWNNLQYLAYGCIGTHFSGDWYNGQVDAYLSNFLNSLNSANWVGHHR